MFIIIVSFSKYDSLVQDLTTGKDFPMIPGTQVNHTLHGNWALNCLLLRPKNKV